MTWAIVAGVGGSLIGTLGSAAIGGAMGGGGGGGGGGALSLGDIANQLALQGRFSPLSTDPALAQLSAQSAYGIGVGAPSLELDILSRQIAESKTPQAARAFQADYGKLQFMIQSGADPAKIQKQLELLNGTVGKYGAGASIMIQNGSPVISFADPAIQQVVDRARADSSGILANRLSAQNRLSQLAAGFPTFTAGDIEQQKAQYLKQVQDEINANYDIQGQNLLQSANTRGFNPAGTLAELEKQRIRDLNAAPTTAAERALQLLGGQQGLAAGSVAGLNAALSPDSQIAIMNAIRNQQTPNTGQLAAAQIGASAQLAAQQSQNRTQLGIAAGSQLSDTGTLLGLLLRNQNQQNPGPGAGGGTMGGNQP